MYNCIQRISWWNLSINAQHLGSPGYESAEFAGKSGMPLHSSVQPVKQPVHNGGQYKHIYHGIVKAGSCERFHSQRCSPLLNLLSARRHLCNPERLRELFQFEGIDLRNCQTGDFRRVDDTASR